VLIHKHCPWVCVDPSTPAHSAQSAPAMTDRHVFNDHTTLVLRSLKGLVASHPYLNLIPSLKVVYRADQDRNKVALICGGGSGHEPGQLVSARAAQVPGLNVRNCWTRREGLVVCKCSWRRVRKPERKASLWGYKGVAERRWDHPDHHQLCVPRPRRSLERDVRADCAQIPETTSTLGWLD
jgi:hypothetical protein